MKRLLPLGYQDFAKFHWFRGLFVVAFGLLLGTAVFVHSEGKAPCWQRVAGAALYSTEVLFLLLVAGYASSLAYDHAMSSRPGVSAPSVLS